MTLLYAYERLSMLSTFSLHTPYTCLATIPLPALDAAIMDPSAISTVSLFPILLFLLSLLMDLIHNAIDVYFLPGKLD